MSIASNPYREKGEYFMTEETKHSLRVWGFWLFMIWLSSQALFNGFNYSQCHNQATAFAPEINTIGPEKYKDKLARVLRKEDYKLTVSDIDIRVNTKSKQYVITLPFTWRLNFGIWTYRYNTTIQVHSYTDQIHESLYDGLDMESATIDTHIAPSGGVGS